MDSKEFKKLYDKANIRRWNLLNIKNREYTRGENRFQRFDDSAAFDGSTPIHELWHSLKKHIQSIKNLVKDDEINPNSEPDLQLWIERLDDARNYLDLLEGLVRRKVK
jgi:hypothetical protein